MWHGRPQAASPMAQIGQFNALPILRESPHGLYLDGGTHGEILLPNRYVTKETKPGGKIDVFVHRDSEDRLVATTEKPLAIVGQCASLRVVSTKSGVGAFLSWGLDKDLLLPLREQSRDLRAHDWVVVYIALDPKSDRIIASTRLKRYLDVTPANYRTGEAVKLLIEAETPLGYRAIINHAHHGLLFHSDLDGKILRIGETIDGFVRSVREDGKVDLSLEKVGYGRIAPLTEQILEKLRAANGRLALHDKSSPQEIQSAFGVSKKAFKQAVGSLYKDQFILIEPTGLRLASPPVKRRQGR
jgi:predicted RNA-binding protein (virulence factor B family)